MASFFLIVLLVSLGVASAVGRWCLGPLDAAAKPRLCPVRFSLIDLLSLMFLVQLPITLSRPILAAIRNERDFIPFLIINALLCLAMVFFWWKGIRRLSRAGIQNPWHRTIVLGLVVPATLLGAAGVVVVPTISIFYYTHSTSALFFPTNPLTPIALEVFLIAVVYATGKYTRYAVTVAGNENEGSNTVNLEDEVTAAEDNSSSS